MKINVEFRFSEKKGEIILETEDKIWKEIIFIKDHYPSTEDLKILLWRNIGAKICPEIMATNLEEN